MAIVRRELPSGLVRMERHDRPPRSRILTSAALATVGVVVAYQLLSGVLFWAQVKVDDLRYGYPRTSAVDGYVGFGESNGLPTHFIALNLHRQIVVLSIAGDDPTHVTTIKGPYLYGPNDEYTPATLRLVDVNGDGYPDLVLSVDHQQVVYIDQPRIGSFRPLLPQERASVARVLGAVP